MDSKKLAPLYYLMAKTISIPLLYLVIGGLFIEIVSNIGMGYDEIEKFYILGIPISDVVLLLMLLTFTVRFSSILNSINFLLVLFILAIGIFATLVGFLSSNNQLTSAMNEDIRIFLWFFGGIAFGYTLIETKNISFHLGLIIIISTFIIVSSSLAISFIALASDIIMDRVSHPNLYNAAGLFFTPLILYICISNKSAKSHMLISSCIIVFIYFVAILAATRSMLLIGFLLILCYFLLAKLNPNIIRLDKEKFKPFSNIFLYFVFSVLLITLLSLLFNADASVINRITTIFDINILMSDPRIYELRDYFNQLSIISIIFGEGFGGGVESTIYNGDLALTLHIGIMNYALKFGWFVFVIIIFFFFLLLPLLITNSYYRLMNNKYTKLTYIEFGCLLSLTPIILSLVISGGYSTSAFMMMGCSYYLYNNAEKVILR